MTHAHQEKRPLVFNWRGFKSSGLLLWQARVFMTPSVSRTPTPPMFDAVAVGANVFVAIVLVERGPHGVGAGLPVVGWFSVGAFLPAVAETETETKASGNFARRTQNSCGRFCGGWTAFGH